MSADKPPRPPTLRDVAHRAGVSIWTASNTFSNPHRVAAATRERVLQAAGELGYAGPNPSARTLALGRSHLIAYSSDGDSARQITDAASALVVQGLTTACDRAGFSVVLAGRTNDLPVDGHVLFRADESSVRQPAICIDPPDDDPLGVVVDIDAGIRDLVDHLRELGHDHLAVLTSPMLRARLAAFTQIAAGARLSVYQSGDDAGWPTRSAGNTATRRILKAEERPTVIVALDDALALGALEAVFHEGLSAPKDISVTGVGDVPGADLAGLTTVMVPYRPMGELAGDVLVAQIESGQPATGPPPLPTGLVIRTSTGPRPE